MFNLQFDPYTTQLKFNKSNASTPPSSSFVQLNSQTLSQDWDLSTGYLKIFTPLDLGMYEFTVEAGCTLEIN